MLLFFLGSLSSCSTRAPQKMNYIAYQEDVQVELCGEVMLEGPQVLSMDFICSATDSKTSVTKVKLDQKAFIKEDWNRILSAIKQSKNKICIRGRSRQPPCQGYEISFFRVRGDVKILSKVD